MQILDLCTSARFSKFCIWSILNSKPGAKQSLRNLSQFVRLVPRGGTEHHGADPTIGPVMGKVRDFGTCTLSDTRLHVEEKVLHVKRPLGVSEGHSASTAGRPHRHRVSAAPSESNNSPSSACTVEPLIASRVFNGLFSRRTTPKATEKQYKVYDGPPSARRKAVRRRR